MKSFARRVLRWTGAGVSGGIAHALLSLIWTAAEASGGFGYALASGSNIQLLLNSSLIGALGGAAAGSVASIPIRKFVQAIATGAVLGLFMGVSSYWLLGSPDSFGKHVTSVFAGCVTGIVCLRYLSDLRRTNYGHLWAERVDVSDKGA